MISLNIAINGSSNRIHVIVFNPCKVKYGNNEECELESHEIQHNDILSVKIKNMLVN
jgi:hypothetical protein